MENTEICGEDDCTNAATLTVHWPRKSVRRCAACTARTVGVAGMLGLDLSLVPDGVALRHVSVGEG